MPKPKETTKVAFGLNLDSRPPAIPGGAIHNYIRGFYIYDSLGREHQLTLTFLKISENKWRAHISGSSEDIIAPVIGSGEVASGIVEFNNEGTLKSVETRLDVPQQIIWRNGAQAGFIDFDFGVLDTNKGLSQYPEPTNLEYIKVNDVNIDPGKHTYGGLEYDDKVGPGRPDKDNKFFATNMAHFVENKRTLVTMTPTVLKSTKLPASLLALEGQTLVVDLEVGPKNGQLGIRKVDNPRGKNTEQDLAIDIYAGKGLVSVRVQNQFDPLNKNAVLETIEIKGASNTQYIHLFENGTRKDFDVIKEEFYNAIEACNGKLRSRSLSDSAELPEFVRLAQNALGFKQTGFDQKQLQIFVEEAAFVKA